MPDSVSWSITTRQYAGTRSSLTIGVRFGVRLYARPLTKAGPVNPSMCADWGLTGDRDRSGEIRAQKCRMLGSRGRAQTNVATFCAEESMPFPWNQALAARSTSLAAATHLPALVHSLVHTILYGVHRDRSHAHAHNWSFISFSSH